MAQRTIGRYEVKSELGRGGMATVFLANDPLIGRDVAVKVLPREFLHDPSFRGRFEREARTIAMLEHPAIVPIYDFGEQDGQPYLVMRYMKGGTLGDRLREGPLDGSEAAGILERLGDALDHAHNRGVIHRDLKPGNILFDEYGLAFLSDFGIVKLAQATATFTGESIIGTPAYMSPEQVHGNREIDGRSDIYTLGIILFEILTGQMPYRADTPAKLMMAHVLNPVPRIKEVRPDLPDAYDAVITRALAKQPDDRFDTASDLSQALTKIVQRAVPTQQVPPQQTATIIEEPAQQPASEPHARPRTPPVPTPSPSEPAATGSAETGARFPRWLLAVAGMAGLAALCCGGLFLLSFLPGGQSPFGAGSATATGEPTAIVEESALPAEETPDEVPVANATATAEADLVAATATAQAQEAAIATRVAESTVTAEARAAASATAYAPTRQAEVAAQAVLQMRENDPIFGPTEGSLLHVSDGFIKADIAEVNVADLVIDAVFYSPYAATSGSWDIGYTFRQVEINDQYRLTVESNGDWSLSEWLGEDSTFIQDGSLNNLNRGNGDANRLTVYANGPLGYFFVNGEFVAELDLSARLVAGNVTIATSMFTGNEIEGEETRYEEFTIWTSQ
ncbi:MAG TPA: serine/threonine-protein kinase [Candidatus Sulfomarinibacteraceae bacterium]|nr:serine/threonine-protein kinase [Candidatus Sulfomarinibacteraceae bacterium]